MASLPRARGKRVSLEGQVIPVQWGADDSVVRIGMLVLDTDEEIDFTNVAVDEFEELIDSFVRVEGVLMAGARARHVLKVASFEFVDDDDLLDEFNRYNDD